MNVPVLPRDVPIPEDSSAKGQGALDAQECQQLDAYWRAANYLSLVRSTSTQIRCCASL
jgi:hypothetical protein